MLSFSQCDIFPQLLHNWLYNNVYSISLAYTYSTIYNYTTQYTNCAVYIYFPFHNVNIFPRLLYNCLFHYVYSEASLDTYSTVYNYSPQYTVCAVYICCPFHNVIFFHNYCTIDSTTMSTAYPQHIHTVLLQLHYPVYWLCCINIYASFTQCDIFSQWLHNSLYNNVYSISSTYTYGTVYNYTTQLTVIAITYAILFTIWYFFTITAQLTLQQCLQHILNIYIRYCLQLKYPVYWLCCLYMLPLHNVTFFHNYCTIDSTTMSTAYPQHIHTVLFTITLPSILTLLFIYASFTQCDIFSQLLHNWLYNNVYSISLAYTYSTIYNYTTQYTNCAVYICFLYTMWYFSSITAQLTLQQCLQHILNIYIRYCYNYTTQYTDFAVYICFLYTMWHFFTITAQLTLQQCLQHILSIYIQYCSQLHYPVYWLCSLHMLSF